jgi:uncharacterized repeat protein (TIGR03803 family)
MRMLGEAHSMRFRGFLVLLAGLLNLASAECAWASPREKVLYQFQGTKDGSSPSSSLVLDASGNLYGTTMQGGEGFSNCNYGCGTVFEIRRSAASPWQEKTIYSFQGGTDGFGPSGNLVFDEAGNLYGTTVGGGKLGSCSYQAGCGTIFELSPNSDGSWTETVLYRFQSTTDGFRPAGLILDAAGNLYGTTSVDLEAGGATVYKLSPPQRKGGAWTEQTLTTFPCCGEAANPVLVLDSHGNLIGMTRVQYGFCDDTCGQVFELTPVGGGWVETSLHQFRGEGNGANPMAGVILDSEGNLYGTTRQGGTNFGVAFELKRKGRQWNPILLYNFCSADNCSEGAHSLAGLVFDTAGNLYGTTYDGGTGCDSGYRGCGTVFKLTHTQSGWREAVLHRFADNPDGSKPAAGLILDSAGNLYGTTVSGGAAEAGTVFEIIP